MKRKTRRFEKFGVFKRKKEVKTDFIKTS